LSNQAGKEGVRWIAVFYLALFIVIVVWFGRTLLFTFGGRNQVQEIVVKAGASVRTPVHAESVTSAFSKSASALLASLTPTSTLFATEIENTRLRSTELIEIYEAAKTEFPSGSIEELRASKAIKIVPTANFTVTARPTSTKTPEPVKIKEVVRTVLITVVVDRVEVVYEVMDTPTMYPTWTPEPTYTPLSTYTPVPTATPGDTGGGSVLGGGSLDCSITEGRICLFLPALFRVGGVPPGGVPYPEPEG
jgi:hypothetical protein